MAQVTFYHQERVDGGRRSGLLVDGNSMLHGFLPGGADRDPALAWYADVTLESETPPEERDALDWLSQHGVEMRAALKEAGRELACGLDVDTVPWEFTYPGSGRPIRISVSAMRRLTARQVGQKLSELSERDWTSLFPALVPHPGR